MSLKNKHKCNYYNCFIKHCQTNPRVTNLPVQIRIRVTNSQLGTSMSSDTENQITISEHFVITILSIFDILNTQSRYVLYHVLLQTILKIIVPYIPFRLGSVYVLFTDD